MYRGASAEGLDVTPGLGTATGIAQDSYEGDAVDEEPELELTEKARPALGRFGYLEPG